MLIMKCSVFHHHQDLPSSSVFGSAYLETDLEMVGLLGPDLAPAGSAPAPLLVLSLLLPKPSCASLCKKPLQSSLRDSFPLGLVSPPVSVIEERLVELALNNGWLNDVFEDTRLVNGDRGSLSDWFGFIVWCDAPGRESPAASCCSSVHPRVAAMICNTWNFFGSDRSRARNWSNVFVTSCLCLCQQSLAKLLAIRTCQQYHQASNA